MQQAQHSLIVRVHTGFGKSWKVMEIEKKKIPGP